LDFELSTVSLLVSADATGLVGAMMKKNLTPDATRMMSDLGTFAETGWAPQAQTNAKLAKR